jgi:hypothetical protein
MAIQGYLISKPKPKPKAEFIRWLNNWQKKTNQ